MTIKYCFPICIAICCLGYISIAQKPTIDTSAFRRWPYVEAPVLSSDGRYTAYDIQNEPINGLTLVVKAIQGDWEVRIAGAHDVKFSENSEVVAFMKGDDSLGMLNVSDRKVRYIQKVSAFEFLRCEAKTYLSYFTAEERFCLINLENGTESSYVNVHSYSCSEDKTALVLEIRSMDNSLPNESLLEWLDLSNLTLKPIFRGSDIGSYIFQRDTHNMCFLGKNKKHAGGGLCIWYYGEGRDSAEYLTCDSALGEKSDLKISRILKFRNDGGGVFFSLRRKKGDSLIKSGSGVWVWNSADAALVSDQLQQFDSKGMYLGPYTQFTSIVWISDHHVVQIEGEGDWVKWPRYSQWEGDTLLIVHNGEGPYEEGYWNENARQSFFLVSSRTGERKRIEVLPRSCAVLELSPTGKYLIWFDRKAANYFSYDIQKGDCFNITKAKKAIWTVSSDRPSELASPAGIFGYIKRGPAVLLYSRNGIYRANLNGRGSPINLTSIAKGLENIRFGPVTIRNDSAFNGNERVIVNTFNLQNKENGFYSISLDGKKPPELLTMKPCFFAGNRDDGDFTLAKVQRAKNENVYIVGRMSATESPNYFSTVDFRSFSPITALYPERKYNWLTTELISWRTNDGTSCQGVLYKPENFDKNKKYPIIFYYYEILSDGLYKYIRPSYSIGPLNIPEYVSNGYLVFAPDIHFKIGFTGNSVVNSVVSAAKYLSKMPWVDSSRMGIQGHSLGGYATYLLVTHTTIFKAAVACEGATDLFSEYESLNGYGRIKQSMFEMEQYRIGETPWHRPDLYIKNSPIFYVDKVRTPLLMMDNKEDAVVSFAQGMEFFGGLRRLRKPAWMLEYDGQGHAVFGEASKDFTIRMRQFFDHYLKNTSCPKWMAEPIPVIRQGVDTGLELVKP